MHPPHPALCWPDIDSDDLRRTSGSLRYLSGRVRIDIDAWQPRALGWIGRSATAQELELEWFGDRGVGIEGELRDAATAIDRLAVVVRSTNNEIRRLAAALHAAEAASKERWARADIAAGLASGAGADPVRAEQLRHRAIRARHRAEEASREADLLRRRSQEAAGELVAELDRVDIATAQQIDGLLRNPISQTRTAHHRRLMPAVQPTDSSWIPMQIDATAAAIRRHADALDEAISRIEAVPWSERTWWESMALRRLSEEVDLHRGFLAPGRQILDWRPNGDGRVVEVFGDLVASDHIAVVVPGIMNTIENFDDQLAADAEHLWIEATSNTPETAVVAWLGYDTPELVNAFSKERAVHHEQELRAFVESLPADAHVTVVAHSYGTVLTAESATRGLGVDDVVMVGSPGTRLDHASEASLEPDAQVFAGVSDTDWVVGRTGYGSIVCPEKIIGAGWLTGLRWVISPVTGPLSWVTDSCNTDDDGDVKGLSHGINPAHEDFGAIEISTEGVSGHSSYLEPGTSSLAAIAQIVTGNHPEQR
jgi:hypothetical protein